VPPGRSGAREETEMKSDEENEDTTTYRVVLNHEEQYSIWPAHHENPAGWEDGGKVGTKAECLAYIEEKWTDMRPLSLRQHMESEESGA
jgi:MbtH protein